MILFPLFAPVALTPVAICYQYQQHPRNRWQIFRRCRWRRWQICHWCLWYRWCTFTCEYPHEFFGKIRNDLNVIFGGLGKMIHEKNLKQKISRYCPFNPPYNDSAQRDALRPMSQRWVRLCLFWFEAKWCSWYIVSMLFVHCQAEWAGDVE